MNTSEILIRAKQELITRGWCQGMYRSPQQEVCSIGAIIAASCAASSDDYGTTFVVSAEIVLHRALGGGPRSIMSWNDDPARTPEEVLAAFDAAIVMAQEHERADRETTAVATDARSGRAVAVSIG